MPRKSDGWSFDWDGHRKTTKNELFALIIHENSSTTLEGLLSLRCESGFLIMDLLEVAPHNLGHENKRYDYVAGCLVAFACSGSFLSGGDYFGFLSFTSKTKLMPYYQKKYGATPSFGQRMYIDPMAGRNLIQKYL